MTGKVNLHIIRWLVTNLEKTVFSRFFCTTELRIFPHSPFLNRGKLVFVYDVFWCLWNLWNGRLKKDSEGITTLLIRLDPQAVQAHHLSHLNCSTQTTLLTQTYFGLGLLVGLKLLPALLGWNCFCRDLPDSFYSFALFNMWQQRTMSWERDARLFQLAISSSSLSSSVPHRERKRERDREKLEGNVRSYVSLSHQTKKPANYTTFKLFRSLKKPQSTHFFQNLSQVSKKLCKFTFSSNFYVRWSLIWRLFHSCTPRGSRYMTS
jgi:hypothetical protein